MNRISTPLILIVGIVFAAASTSRSSDAPTQEEVRRAFVDLHDDNIPHNCEHATEWLLKYRDQLKEDLLDELYKTDRQGRDAILHVLFNTPSFVPDERFMRFVLARLPESNKYVKSNLIFKDVSPAQIRISWNGAHWEAWKFINDHFEAFEPMLKEQIGTTNDVWVLWATAWLAKRRGVLQDYSPLFTPAVLEKAATNLAADNKAYNASQAVRLFLLLGDQSLPVLREATKSRDQQMADLARATIDALNGKRKGFGYLFSKLDLTEVLFGTPVDEPEWISEAGEPYFNNDRPY